jgi:hypothetical protein
MIDGWQRCQFFCKLHFFPFGCMGIRDISAVSVADKRSAT